MENNITKEHIKEAVDYVYHNNPFKEERKIKAFTGCKTLGLINWDNFCDDENCFNCVNRKEILTAMFEEEVKKQKREYLFQDVYRQEEKIWMEMSPEEQDFLKIDLTKILWGKNE